MNNVLLLSIGCLLLVDNISTFFETDFIQLMIQKYKSKGLKLREDPYHGNLPIMNEYDFVIAGASPAGCVLANRLTEDPNVTVLLLESGPEENTYTDIPAFSILLLATEFNWEYKSEPEEGVCLAMNNEICPWPSGRAIGGATVYNGMIYTRGNKLDFDSWADEGNEGWNYENVLKYFILSEKNRIDSLAESTSHGKNGTLTIDYPPFKSKILDIFLNAGIEKGYSINDYNEAGSHIGFSRVQSTVRNGKRVSASKAFLLPIQSRKNLHIAQRAHVTKVLFQSGTKTANGVEFIKNGKKREVYVTREVILSAGAFGSPKILMLSGIGPRKHLEDFDIKVLVDLPVGDNLMEHIGVSSLTFTSEVPLRTNLKQESQLLPISVLQWEVSGQGPLSSVGCEGLAYIKSRFAKEGDTPDIELIVISTSYSSDFGNILSKSIGVRPDIYDAVYRELENNHTFSFWVMGLYPYSKGTVRLRSKDPMALPRIENNFLTDKRDLNVIIDGIRAVLSLEDTMAMKSIGAKFHKKKFPACIKLEFDTDEYWECYIRQITAQYHHQSGTCKMGPEYDPTSVVNSQLQIHSIKSLRVVDASIMPSIVGAHTMASSYMIGEKASDIIKKEYNIAHIKYKS